MDPGLTSSRRSDEAAVRAVEEEYDRAWNTADIPSIMRLVTDDVVVTNPSGEASVGHDAMRSSLVALFEGAAKGSVHTSDILGVYFVANDVALVDGLATIDGFGTSDSPLRHHYTDVLLQREDGWRIAHVRAYTFMPPPGSSSAGRWTERG
jgi:uncharacterized protein (TIGR02246 family)